MRRFAVSIVLALLAVLRFYTALSAHVTLVSSQPAANAMLASSPASIRLEFSEPVEPEVAHLFVVRSDGQSVPLTIANDPHDVHVLIAQPGDLGTGTVRLVWHVVSEDGHSVGGSLLFTIGAATAPPSEEQAERAESVWGPSVFGAPIVPAALRGFGVGSLAALCGILYFVWTFRATIDERATRLAVWLSIISAALLCAHLVAWSFNVAPGHRIDMDWISSALGTTVGRNELWRALLALPPLWALILARRPGLALILTIPPILVSSAIGHSSAFSPTIAIPAKALHLLALAAWLGGLLWLIVRERSNTARFAREARYVSTVALWAVAVLALSGVAQTLILIPSFGALQSNYGLVLIAKVVGLLVLMAFGAYHRSRVVPALTGGTQAKAESFRGSLKAEVVVLWLVILLGGLLAYISPPMTSQPPSASSQTAI